DGLTHSAQPDKTYFGCHTDWMSVLTNGTIIVPSTTAAEPRRINHGAAMSSLADLDALVVGRRYGEANLVILHLQDLCSNRYVLTDFRGSHVPHVHMSTHGLFIFVQVRLRQYDAG